MNLPARNERPRLPVAPTHATILDALGPSGLAQFIAGGLTQEAIAAMIGVARTSIACWISNLEPAQRAVIRAAAQASAEPLMDEAQAILDEPVDPDLGISGPQVALRQARANFRARRAGIRNAAYREKAPVAEGDEQEAPRAPSVHFTISIAEPVDRHGRTITVTPEPVPLPSLEPLED